MRQFNFSCDLIVRLHSLVSPVKHLAMVLGVCVVLGVSANAEQAQAANSDSDWSQDAGNAGRTRYVDVNVRPQAISELWNAPILYNHTASHVWNEWDVAIDKNHVYRTALEGYPPSGDFHILALELNTGNQQWNKTIRGGAHAGVRAPSVGDGIVYVNRAGHSGISGGGDSDYPKLYGLNAETGEELFVRNYSSQWGSYDRPHVRGDNVIMEGGYYGGTYSYSAGTGHVRWSNSGVSANVLAQDGFYSHDGLRSYANAAKIRDLVHPSSGALNPVLASTVADLLLAVSGGTLSAFNESGSTWEWDYGLGAGSAAIGATPDRVVVAGPTGLEILDRETGALLANWDSSSSLNYGQLAVTNTHAFVQDSRGLVSAVNLNTGLSDWSQSAPIGTLAVGHGLLVLSSRFEVRAYALVPEPSACVLFALGAVGLCIYGRCRSSSSTHRG